MFNAAHIPPSPGRPSRYQQAASGPEAAPVPPQSVPPAPAGLPPASYRSGRVPAWPAVVFGGTAPPPTTAAPSPAAAAQRPTATVAVHAAAPTAEPTQSAHAAALWNSMSVLVSLYHTVHNTLTVLLSLHSDYGVFFCSSRGQWDRR